MSLVKKKKENYDTLAWIFVYMNWKFAIYYFCTILDLSMELIIDTYRFIFVSIDSDKR